MQILGLTISRADTKPVVQTVSEAVRGYVAESGGSNFMPQDYINDANFIAAGTVSTQLNFMRAVVRGELLSMTNGIYHRVLEIGRDHICGQGAEIEVETEDESLEPVIASLNKVCQEHFAKNAVAAKVSQWVYEGLQSGELAIPVKCNDATGEVKLGDIPARWIQDVAQDIYSASDVLAIKVEQADVFRNTQGKYEVQYGGAAQWMPVIRECEDAYVCDKDGKVIFDSAGMAKKHPDCGKLSGEVAFLRLGNLRGAKRGQGDGFAIQDLCIELEQFIFSFRRAYEMQLAVVFEETYQGVDEKKIDEYSKRVIPTGPFPYVHNKGVEFKMHSPALHVGEMTETIATMVRLIAGIMGIPEFMLGDGTGTNVATAEQQTPALYQKFNQKRQLFQEYFSNIFRFIATQASKRGQIADDKGNTVYLTAAQLKAVEFKFTFKPYERNNAKDNAEGVKSLTDAVLAMMSLKMPDGTAMIPPEDIRDALYNSLQTLGVQIDKPKETPNSLPITGVSSTGSAVDMQDVLAAK